ncbi:MAG TPA: ABC transporter ATP-binding protein [Ornithinibacillus sp.]|nr:ABC transporter ATP-binding protein [Ornithinibacillus sp.]
MLVIHDVTKYYRNKLVLEHISLDIPSGSCIGLVGPNGAGKSTLLKILASIIQDYQGKVQLNNTKSTFQKKVLGYVPQEICLEQSISAYSNLCFFGKLYGLIGRQLKKRATEVLEEIGLSSHAKNKVLHFSGGMKRRLNIGCALMHQPKLIIMDEPTVGIDPQSRRHIFEMIRHLQETGCTIIYATHYMEEVEQLCNKVAFLDCGKIVEQGDISTLIQKYTTPSVFVKAKNLQVTALDKLGQISAYRQGFLIKTEMPIAVMKQILLMYQANTSELERLELVKPRLEDVFFTLTGSELREGVHSSSKESSKIGGVS